MYNCLPACKNQDKKFEKYRKIKENSDHRSQRSMKNKEKIRPEVKKRGLNA
jgi:hypothetical protein